MDDYFSESVDSFAGICTQELRSKLRRLSSFTSHPGSIGYHHEEVVKEVIRPMLSARFSLRTGFLFADSGVVSDQCDLIIVDENDPSPYLFKLGNLVVVHPRAVAAVIEIKTKLSKKTFHQAINNLYRAREVAREAKPNGVFMTFVFAFEGAHLTIDTLNRWYKDASLPNSGISYPQMIYVLNEGALDLRKFNKDTFGHRFIIGEQGDELKSRTLSTLLISIKKALELHAGLETNPFEFADIEGLAWSKQYFQFGIGVVEPDEDSDGGT